MEEKTITRLKYENDLLCGLIRVTGLVGMTPTNYSLKLYDKKHGFISTRKINFKTAEEAKAHATLYGCLPHLWKIEN